MCANMTESPISKMLGMDLFCGKESTPPPHSASDLLPPPLMLLLLLLLRLLLMGVELAASRHEKLYASRRPFPPHFSEGAAVQLMV